jgi:hypothetical protein
MAELLLFSWQELDVWMEAESRNPDSDVNSACST